MTQSPAVAGESTADGPDRRARAEALLELVHTDVNFAKARAQALLAEAAGDEAAVVALRVLGLSVRFSDTAQACALLRRSIDLARRLDLPVRAAQARTSLLVLLSQGGRTQAALREAALAEAALGHPDQERELAQLRVNHGLVLQRIGRTAEALTSFGEAAPVLSRHGDVRWEAVLRNLRGTLLVYQGRNEAGTADLRRGIELAKHGGLDAMLCTLYQNLGFAFLQAGRIPEALEQISLALNLAQAMDRRLNSALADRADALLAAGLAHEALENAERAIAGQLEIGRAFDAAESRLAAARAALAADEVSRALAQAARARADFTRQRRHTWAAWAWQVELAARYAEGERSRELLRELTLCVARLERAGWLLQPQQARLLAARTAAAIGRRAQAERLYAQIGAARSADLSTLRILAWEAESERRLLRGDRAGAGRAVTRGLGVLAEYAGTLGATDLRAGVASLGADLARNGLRLSLEGGAARSVLIRAEQWRAASLRRAPVRPAQSGRWRSA